jgi:hypothetical protein
MLKILYTACAVIAVVSTISIINAATKAEQGNVATKTEQGALTEKERAFYWQVTTEVTIGCIKPTVNWGDPKDYKYYTDALWIVSGLTDNFSYDVAVAASHAVIAEEKRLGMAEFCRVWKPELDGVIQTARKRSPKQLEQFYQNTRREMRHDQ